MREMVDPETGSQRRRHRPRRGLLRRGERVRVQTQLDRGVGLGEPRQEVPLVPPDPAHPLEEREDVHPDRQRLLAEDRVAVPPPHARRQGAEDVAQQVAEERQGDPEPACHRGEGYTTVPDHAADRRPSRSGRPRRRRRLARMAVVDRAAARPRRDVGRGCRERPGSADGLVAIAEPGRAARWLVRRPQALALLALAAPEAQAALPRMRSLLAALARDARGPLTLWWRGPDVAVAASVDPAAGRSLAELGGDRGRAAAQHPRRRRRHDRGGIRGGAARRRTGPRAGGRPAPRAGRSRPSRHALVAAGGGARPARPRLGRPPSCPGRRGRAY